MGQGVLQTRCIAYPQQAQAPALTPQGALSKQIALISCKVTNKSAGACDLGVLRGFSNSNWSLGITLSGVLTDETAVIQAGTAVSIFDTTINDGFLVSSPDQFGLVGLTISQAQSGSPVYTYKYWNGTAWTTLPTIAVPTTYTAAYQLIVFLPPPDWVPGGTTPTGVNTSTYNIWVQSSTAGGQAVKATGAVVGQFLDYAPSVAQYGNLKWSIDDHVVTLLMFKAGDFLLPYFGTAAAGNSVTAQYLNQY